MEDIKADKPIVRVRLPWAMISLITGVLPLFLFIPIKNSAYHWAVLYAIPVCALVGFAMAGIGIAKHRTALGRGLSIFGGLLSIWWAYFFVSFLLYLNAMARMD